MPDYDTSMPIYHRLADATSLWEYLHQNRDDLPGRLASAAAFAVDGSEIEVADVDITLEGSEAVGVSIVILTADRLVTIGYVAEKPITTRVQGLTAIRSVHLLEVPHIFASREGARRGPLVVRLELDDGIVLELGSHSATPKHRDELRAALPKLLGRLR